MRNEYPIITLKIQILGKSMYDQYCYLIFFNPYWQYCSHLLHWNPINVKTSYLCKWFRMKNQRWNIKNWPWSHPLYGNWIKQKWVMATPAIKLIIQYLIKSSSHFHPNYSIQTSNFQPILMMRLFFSVREGKLGIFNYKKGHQKEYFWEYFLTRSW